MSMAKGEYLKCDACGEQSAVVRVSVTTLQGSVLDTGVFCRDCWHASTKEMSIGDGPLPAVDDPNQEP
jgi:hypothetical protein